MTQPVPVSQSRTIKTALVLPSDTQHHHTIFGGRVMYYIDDVAAICAMRHCHTHVVTASVDSLDFLSPVKVGAAVNLEAFVTWTGRTSMEVFVKVFSEELLTGKKDLTVTCFLTMVAVGEDGKPTEVPPVIPETEEEDILYQTAPARRDKRRERKKELKDSLGQFSFMQVHDLTKKSR